MVMRREMTTSIDNAVCFRPSRVEGVENAGDVCISREAIEIISAGKRLTFPFLAFARGREISSGRVPVGELHFSKSSYPDPHFVFYTTPRIVVFMPSDGPQTYPHSHFWRVQAVLRDGGLKLYEDGPPKVPPTVLDPRPARTIAYVLAVLGFAWVYGLAGFFSEPAGGAWRKFLLSNPRNPSIGLAFMLPATVIPALLAFRHGRTTRALAAIIAASYVMALVSEWALRHAVHSWAPLELPPFNMRFWSAHYFGSLVIVVVVVALIGCSWRRAFLEPLARPHGGLAAAA